MDFLDVWSRGTSELSGTINVFVIYARRRLDLRLQAGDGNMSFNGAVNGAVPTEAALDIGVPELGNCTVPPDSVIPEAGSTKFTAKSRFGNRLAFRPWLFGNRPAFRPWLLS